MRLELAVGGGYGDLVVPRGDQESEEWVVTAVSRQRDQSLRKVSMKIRVGLQTRRVNIVWVGVGV